jgi:3-hydroxyisobutyrate dehydrogenase
MASIGFIGLGHMGLPMAINLVKANHQVMGFDLQTSALEEFSKQGGSVAQNLIEVAKGKDVIITMLQTGQQVAKVCQGNDGVFQHLSSNSLSIDCSTIDVNTSREIHRLAKENHLLSVDAPVSGGVAGAAAGTLTFMVGGEVNAYQAAHPILAGMGQKIIHTGGSGSGQAAKICNNMILGISMVAISEAFTLAKELGLSPEKLFEVVNNSSGQCWALSKYVPVPGILDKVPANNQFKPGFAAQMMLKDLLLSQQASEAVQVKTPLGSKTTELYKEFINKGRGELDFSAIIQLIAEEQEV